MPYRPNQSIWIAIKPSTEPVLLHPDQLYDDDHPYVRARPELFDDIAGEIEQATAAPGEKRNSRR